MIGCWYLGHWQISTAGGPEAVAEEVLFRGGRSSKILLQILEVRLPRNHACYPYPLVSRSIERNDRFMDVAISRCISKLRSVQPHQRH